MKHETSKPASRSSRPSSMAAAMPARLAYTLEGFCDACSVTRTFAYSAIRDGRLRTFKAGRRRMVSGDAARDFLRLLETGDKAAA